MSIGAALDARHINVPGGGADVIRSSQHLLSIRHGGTAGGNRLGRGHRSSVEFSEAEWGAG
jgi:hypothetical protein